MARINLLGWVVWVCLVASLEGPVRAQQLPTRKDQTKSKRSAWLHEVYLRDASAYKFFLDDQKRQELKLRTEPVMRWTSDADYNGEVYVWTYQGAAAIVGCIFSGPQGKNARIIMHEFHSLAPNRLYAEEGGGTAWLPQEPGIKLEPVLGAPAPSQTQALRLTQMRDPPRRFTAKAQRENLEGGDAACCPSRSTGTRSRMKIRRSSMAALFAFVWTAGTDPELLVATEARRSEKWRPGGITPRRGSPTVKRGSQYEGKEVWKADPANRSAFSTATTTPLRRFPGEDDSRTKARSDARRLPDNCRSAGSLWLLECILGKIRLMEPTAIPISAENEDVTNAPPPDRVRIVSTPGTCGGRPRIDGHRITVEDVASLAQAVGHEPRRNRLVAPEHHAVGRPFGARILLRESRTH